MFLDTLKNDRVLHVGLETHRLMDGYRIFFTNMLLKINYLYNDSFL